MGKKQKKSPKQNNTRNSLGYIPVGVVVGLLVLLGGVYLAGRITKSEPVKSSALQSEINRNKDYSTTNFREEIDQLLEQYSQDPTEETRISIDELYGNWYYTKNRRDITLSDLEWLRNSPTAQLRAIAGYFAEYDLSDRELAKEILAEFLDVHYEFPNEETMIIALDTLSQIAVAEKKGDLAIEIFTRALNLRKSNANANRWYGFLIAELLEKDLIDQAQDAVDQCLLDLQDYPDPPFHCYHQAGMLGFFKGNLRRSLHFFTELYRVVLKNWRDEQGVSCPAKFVPLSLDWITSEKRRETGKVFLENLFENISLSSPPECSKQEWPYHVAQYNPKIPGSQREVEYYTGDDFDEVECYSDERKSAVVYQFHEATVLGPRKLITENHNGSCTLYTPSFPYVNALAQPRYDGIVTRKYDTLPIKDLDNAVILPFLDENFFHFTVEGLPQLVLLMEQSFVRDKNITILTSPTNHAAKYLNYLGLMENALQYEYQAFRYHIKNLFVVDWTWSDSEISASKGSLHHFEDYYIPPASALHLLREKLTQRIPMEIRMHPRNLIVFLHRKSGGRQIVDHIPLYKRIHYVAESHGLLLRLHGYQDTDLQGDIELFYRAVVVIGIHGAGFSNMIWCQPKTAIIELPVSPDKVSVYLRMSAAFDFPYWTVPKTKFYQYASLQNFNEYMMRDTIDTLNSALEQLGYPAK